MSAFTIVLAILVAAGLVGLIAWQAAPWLIDSGKQETRNRSADEAGASRGNSAAATPRRRRSPESGTRPPCRRSRQAKPTETTPPPAPPPTPKAETEEPVPEPPEAKPAEPAPAATAGTRPRRRRRRSESSPRPPGPGFARWPLRHILPHALHDDGARRAGTSSKSRCPDTRPSIAKSIPAAARKTCRPS